MVSFQSRRGVIQVAGVVDAAEARALAAEDVDYLGFPLRLGHHAPDTSEEEAARIVRAAGIQARAVLITYETDPRAALDLADRLGARVVQLHADVPPVMAEDMRALNPEVAIIKSLVVRGSDPAPLIEVARGFEPFVAAFITDTFDPETGAMGATGKTHPWEVSAALVRAVARPLILAGGLHPGNVSAAIAAVRPAGVDAHTGLEAADGRKDPDKVRAFVAAARDAFARLTQ